VRDERGDVLGPGEIEPEGLDLEPLLIAQLGGRGLTQSALPAGQDDPVAAPAELTAGLEPHAAVAARHDGDPSLLGHVALPRAVAQLAGRAIDANA
jgi:hypothetical protein